MNWLSPFLLSLKEEECVTSSLKSYKIWLCQNKGFTCMGMDECDGKWVCFHISFTFSLEYDSWCAFQYLYRSSWLHLSIMYVLQRGTMGDTRLFYKHADSLQNQQIFPLFREREVSKLQSNYTAQRFHCFITLHIYNNTFSHVLVLHRVPIPPTWQVDI